MGTFWEIIASNAAVATILAILATGLGRVWRNAAAIHVLWVVVLLKLFAPPLITAGVPFALIASPIASTDEPPAYSLMARQIASPGTPAPVSATVTVFAPAAIPNAMNGNFLMVDVRAKWQWT